MLVVYVAIPAVSVAVPIGTPPSLNVTVPVAPDPVIVAVKVTGLPYVNVVALGETLVVDIFFCTFCARMLEADPEKFASAL